MCYDEILDNDGKAKLYDSSGKPFEIPGTVTGISRDKSGLLAANEKGIIRVGVNGIIENISSAGIGATAMAVIGEFVVAGYDSGKLESLSPSTGKTEVKFERPPDPHSVNSNKIINIMEGPKDLVIAGLENGFVGVWDGANGKLLDHTTTHGAPVHMKLIGNKLYTASDIGSYSVLDLSIYDRDYCELMREIWDQVPVVWKSGKPVVEEPPKDHRCSGVN